MLQIIACGTTRDCSVFKLAESWFFFLSLFKRNNCLASFSFSCLLLWINHRWIELHACMLKLKSHTFHEPYKKNTFWRIFSSSSSILNVEGDFSLPITYLHLTTTPRKDYFMMAMVLGWTSDRRGWTTPLTIAIHCGHDQDNSWSSNRNWNCHSTNWLKFDVLRVALPTSNV